MRSLVRIFAFAVFCLAPFLQGRSSAHSVPALPEDYVHMVGLYASGEEHSALALLGGWSQARIRQQREELSEAVVSIRKCPACPTRAAFLKFPTRAALLLHADREMLEQFSPPVSEQIAQCGTGPHATIVDHLASILLLIDPEAGGFLRPLYLAVAQLAEWSHCFNESRLWARAGLRFFPKDANLLMAVAVAEETGAFFVIPPAPRSLDQTPAVVRQTEALTAKLRDQWHAARRAFEEVLLVSPDHAEARLRLGRILWRVERPDEARECFDKVLAKAGEAHIQYLAHLFLGRVLEDKRDWAAAEEHYRIALSMQPVSHVAAVALSHVRFLQGDLESARDTLDKGLEAAKTRTEFDPWVPYLITQTPQGQKILAELRHGLRP